MACSIPNVSAKDDFTTETRMKTAQDQKASQACMITPAEWGYSLWHYGSTEVLCI